MSNIDLTKISEEYLAGLSEEEKASVLAIVKEVAEKGNSDTLNNILLADYDEAPVDIETFLTDDKYLGQAWKDATGKSKLYPFWLETLKKIFPNNFDTDYDTLLESGARGIGKSEVACGTICPYLMYRVLCLKNPLEFYHIKLTEKIAFAFMNIKLDLAEAIATDKFQKTIQMSPWFMSRGSMTKRNNKPYWNPPDPIEIIIGSQSDDLIGRPIFFCLAGNTLIKTTNGIEKLDTLVNKDIQVISIDEQGKEVISEHCTVKPTLKTNEEYQIELEDGSIIRCTSTHRFMLKDGSYKMAKDLTEDDELFDESMTYKEFIKNIIDARGQWNIPEGEYWEGHHIIPKCLGGEGRTEQKHTNIIRLYAHEHFIAHKLLAKENPNNKSLVYAWSMMAFPKGKTKREFEITPEEYEEIRILQSKIQLGSHITDEVKKKLSDINKGKKLSKEVREKISKGNKGKVVSKETRLKMSESAKSLDRSHYKTSKGKVCITNDVEIKYINKDESLPNDWYYGNCKTSNKHDMYNYYNNPNAMFENSKSKSGSNNSMYGHGERVSGGKNGHAIYIYTYCGVDYYCRDALMIELKKEFPTISESAIRRIMSHKYTQRISSKYQFVIDNLTWRLKKDENQIN